MPSPQLPTEEFAAKGEINPYSPTVRASQPGQLPLPQPELPLAITNSRVAGRTIVAVAYSGAAFVFLLLGLGFSFVLISMLQKDQANEILQMATLFPAYVLLATMAGFLLALLAAVLVVPSMMWLVGDSDAFGGHDWDRRSIRLFASVCGTICGWGSLVVLSGLQPTAFLVGLAPAAVGLIATPLFLRRLLREADLIAESR